MRDTLRDYIAKDLGPICLQTGSAPPPHCLLIRGVSDYADSHQGEAWKRCAVATAAAYARELLEELPSQYPLPNRAQFLDELRYEQIFGDMKSEAVTSNHTNGFFITQSTRLGLIPNSW
ncbi:hypothetical protein TWF569_000209 [Orbilia oligospora]|nr:hypothetical protein TWF569_000209 [Orbilia oligospora]